MQYYEILYYIIFFKTAVFASIINVKMMVYVFQTGQIQITLVYVYQASKDSIVKQVFVSILEQMLNVF